MRLWSYLSDVFLKWEILLTKVIEKIKTHILLSITFPEFRAACEIMWKNMVQLARPQMTIKYSACAWHVRWIKATDTLTALRNTACFSTVKMVTWTRHGITLYYIACLVHFCLVHKILFNSVLRILTHDDRFLKISSYFRMIMDHISNRLRNVMYILKSMHRINIVV